MLRLDECMEGVDTEAVKLLLTYMYSPDSTSVITGMDMQQLEKAAVLADIWAMSRFLELCDAHLHGALSHPSCWHFSSSMALNRAGRELCNAHLHGDLDDPQNWKRALWSSLHCIPACPHNTFNLPAAKGCMGRPARRCKKGLFPDAGASCAQTYACYEDMLACILEHALRHVAAQDVRI